MDKHTLTVLATAFLVLTSAVPARAAEERTHPCVVIVGIGRYADEQILPRPHAEDDAKALYDVFTNKEYSAIGAGNVRLLLGTPDANRASEPATHENIVKALRWAAASAGRDDPVLLALFMQGAPLGDRECYLASDSTFADRAKNALTASEVESALEKLHSQKFCAFLDVNIAGFKAEKGASPSANLPNFYKEFLGEVKEDSGPPPGRILFLANTGLKPSLEAESHGVFMQAVLDGLTGAADKEGYEPDGLVTVDELITYLNKELPNLIEKYGKNREERDQRYIILGSRSTHFELTRNPRVAAQIRERLDKFNRLAAEKNLSTQLTDEGRQMLSRMPRLEVQRDLRKAYQRLADGTLTVDQLEKERATILAGSKLDRATARNFAAKVIHASQLVSKEYVKEVSQGELVASAVRGLYSRIDEKVPADIKKRLDQAKGLKEEELTNLLTDVRERLGKREDLASHKDIDFALQRMMGPLDPYTTYIDPETLAQFRREMGGNFTGIGVQIRPDTATHQLLVVTPIKDSPAYKAGMKTGDIITQIRREVDSEGKALATPEVIATKGLPISDAVKKIVGKPGTKVKLTVERESVDKPIEFEIRRGVVEVESVLGHQRKADDSWDFLIDPDSRIAYVRLTQFSKYTERDLDRVLKQLKKSGGIKGFILDLRFNPGGLLTSAVNISDMFVDDGLIVTIKPRVGRETPYFGEHENSHLDFPMVCLINGHSASGSEIVSACLQDHGRARVMGERSYGKGSVQNIQPFEEGEIKLTTASFWRPSGKNLNKSSTKGKEDEDWGVTPDKGYVLSLSPKERDELEDHLRKQEIIPRRDLPPKEGTTEEFKDGQLDMALKYLRNQIRLAAQVPSKKAG
jgi:C-terminal peptidase prc